MTDYQSIDARIAELGINLTAEFVPASRFDDDWRKSAINVNVTLTRGRAELRTPYAYGVGHLPGYAFCEARTVDRDANVRRACDTGKWSPDPTRQHYGRKPVPQPELRDVLYSLLRDYDVLDYPSFENWADNYGLDPDSRSAEKTYQTCLQLALKMRVMFTDSEQFELRELFQDY